MPAVLDPNITELGRDLETAFESAEEEASHTAWLRSEMAKSLADPRPGIPHEEVMRRLDERLAYWEAWHKAKAA